MAVFPVEEVPDVAGLAATAVGDRDGLNAGAGSDLTGSAPALLPSLPLGAAAGRGFVQKKRRRDSGSSYSLPGRLPGSRSYRCSSWSGRRLGRNRHLRDGIPTFGWSSGCRSSALGNWSIGLRGRGGGYLCFRRDFRSALRSFRHCCKGFSVAFGSSILATCLKQQHTCHSSRQQKLSSL